MREFAEDILNRIRDEISRIKADKELMGRLYLITLASALLVLAVVVRGPEQKGKVHNDASGHAIEIERYSTNTSESYDFELSIDDGNEVTVRNISLTIQAVNEGNDSVLGPKISRADEIEAALDSVISEIEYSRSERIRLPDELSDGSKISWKRLDKKDYTPLFLIPAIYAALLIFAVRYSGEKGANDEKKRRNSIIRGLPRFCNQLHLMMNAGMILSDAFELISENYAAALKEGEDNNDSSNYFESELARMHMKNPDRRKSSASIINEFAVENDVKEMIRIATILTENEKRGSDVIESLSRESRYLWDERKIVARESGKMIDTKMSYPLGILLVLLIVITMAPAMLSM